MTEGYGLPLRPIPCSPCHRAVLMHCGGSLKFWFEMEVEDLVT